MELDPQSLFVRPTTQHMSDFVSLSRNPNEKSYSPRSLAMLLISSKIAPDCQDVPAAGL